MTTTAEIIDDNKTIPLKTNAEYHNTKCLEKITVEIKKGTTIPDIPMIVKPIFETPDTSVKIFGRGKSVYSIVFPPNPIAAKACPLSCKVFNINYAPEHKLTRLFPTPLFSGLKMPIMR